MSPDFHSDGVEVFPAIVSANQLKALCREMSGLAIDRAGHRLTSVDGTLHCLITGEGSLARLARRLIGADAQPVKVLLFDKSVGRNWSVPWHQDRVIAVERKAEIDGFDRWPVKDGVVHVEPPAEVLAAMVALRLHLDPCGLDNGPLRAILGSSSWGRIPAGEIAGRVKAGNPITLCASPGDVVAMAGLTIHASSPATTPDARRVVHVDFCAKPLPTGLEWAFANRPRSTEPA